MGGVIILRNGFAWAGSGWEFRAILAEVLPEFDCSTDSEIIDILEDSEGVAQVVDLIDLTDASTWESKQAERVEKALNNAYHRIKETGVWRNEISLAPKREIILELLGRICRREEAPPP